MGELQLLMIGKEEEKNHYNEQQDTLWNKSLSSFIVYLADKIIKNKIITVF
ncbi:hypothetical protein [Desulfosarcina variabilis]|uniref:hypothetical protein n=1 Tax=Desulfosarcina variabilis TaxID=2300 RepID=UPI003AFB1AFC